MTTTPEMYARFKDAPWFKQYSITIGGVGGIGSWLGVYLSKAGHKLNIYDTDIVEQQNLGGQFYAAEHVGKPKTASLKDTARRYGNNTNVQELGLFDEKSLASGIMFSAFDNMKARKIMSERWFEYQMNKARDRKLTNTPKPPEEVNVFIDGRMEAESGIIYIVDSPERYKRYQAELFDDSKVPDAPCAFRATSHNPGILAGYMVGAMNNVIANNLRGKAIRSVPFKMTYELPTFTHDVTD